MATADDAMGQRLRELRMSLPMQQADAAARLEVSAAYLSLLETGKRPVQLPFLVKALELYKTSVEAFMASAGERRAGEGIARLLDEPLFRTLSISEDDLKSMGNQPRVAATIAALFNLYKNTRSQLDHVLVDAARRERKETGGGELAFDYSAFDEVQNVLERRGNWFAEIESRAEAFASEHRIGSVVREDDLVRALKKLDVDVQRARAPARGSVIRRLDPGGGTLELSRDVPEHRRLFQLAHAVALRLFDSEHLHEPIIGRELEHEETPTLLKIHLANYFAGALLLPYGPLVSDAVRTRYDVDLLARNYQTSYETVAHRLTNLSDPKRRGVPFHFLRVDVAGNISKRYSTTGLRFPQGTGSCPKWIVHQAFLTPHAISRQYSIFPDGQTFFCFVRVVAEPISGSLARGTVYAIGLGTRAEDAKHLAYADDMPFANPEQMSVPVGTTCRFCERADCNQRAAPSYKFAFRVDEYVKKDNFFSPQLLVREPAGEREPGAPDVPRDRLRRRTRP